MSGVTRDLGVAEPWKASLARSQARRRARELRFVPAGSRARRISLGTLVALAAGPATGLAEGTGTGAPARATTGAPARATTGAPTTTSGEPTTTTEHEILTSTRPASGPKDRSPLEARARARSRRTGPEATGPAAVRKLQAALGVPVDGEFGPITEAAVRHLQARSGIVVDGVVGPETWRALGLPREEHQIIYPPASAVPHPRRHRARADAGTGAIRARTPARRTADAPGPTPAPGTVNRASRRTVRPATARGGRTSTTGGSTSSSVGVATQTDAGSSAASAFVQCVTMRESSMNWHIVDPPYSGGDQWTRAMWLAAGGGRFAPTAAQATPEQQTQVFEEFEPSHPGDWPVTVRACS
jgi:peptidoglycan hydrolase-like protein with peptidoglycan-binding domain